MQRELDWTKLAAGDSPIAMWILKQGLKLTEESYYIELFYLLRFVPCVMCPMWCVMCVGHDDLPRLVARPGAGAGLVMPVSRVLPHPRRGAHRAHRRHWQHSDRMVWLHDLTPSNWHVSDQLLIVESVRCDSCSLFDCRNLQLVEFVTSNWCRLVSQLLATSNN